MTVWWAIAVLVAAGVAWLTWPLLRRRVPEDAGDAYQLALYRAQMEELEVEPDASSASRRDAIGRTIVQLAERTSRRGGARDLLGGAALAVVMVLGSVALYGEIGSPELRDMPLAARLEADLTKRAGAGDIEARVALLAKKVSDEPENFEAWRMLARSYMFLKQYDKATTAFKSALALRENDTDILSAYGEAVTLANGNKVSETARLVFYQVLRDKPEDPRARHYMALYEAQAKRFDQALAQWLALLEDTPADAGWAVMIKTHVSEMARLLGKEPKDVIPAKHASDLDKADPAVRAAELEANLEAEPKDYEAWLELARTYANMGKKDEAMGALERVSNLYEAAPFVQQQIHRTAQVLRLEIEREERGPDAEDVAAASDMSDEDRAQMINQMVAGLAARLEEEPDDINGWLMLIRSYKVLEQTERAQSALRMALGAFEGKPSELSSLKTLAGELGLRAE